MLLSDLVKYVNAKSFGETHYTYSDIYPYFQEAINSLNAAMDLHRHIANAPVITEDMVAYSNAAYTAVSDMHINNYIVTYIVVAMDNASLSVTSRTQTYATQLNQYKQQLISDLYRFMPITASTNVYFDLDTSAPSKHNPNVKAVYDEKIGGVLCGNGDKVPVQGVICDNPYGKIIPKYPEQKIAIGTYNYEYVFIPNTHFKQYYNNVIVLVTLTGYDIPYDPLSNTTGLVYDLGVRDTLEDLTRDASNILNTKDMSIVVGSYIEDGLTKSTVFVRDGYGVVNISNSSDPSAPEINTTLDETSKEVTHVLVDNTDTTYTQVNNLHIVFNSDITHGFSAGLNLVTKDVAPTLSVENNSSYNIIVIHDSHRIVLEDGITLGLNKNVLSNIFCDGVKIYWTIREV